MLIERGKSYLLVVDVQEKRWHPRWRTRQA